MAQVGPPGQWIAQPGRGGRGRRAHATVVKNCVCPGPFSLLGGCMQAPNPCWPKQGSSSSTMPGILRTSPDQQQPPRMIMSDAGGLAAPPPSCCYRGLTGSERVTFGSWCEQGRQWSEQPKLMARACNKQASGDQLTNHMHCRRLTAEPVMGYTSPLHHL